MVDSLKRHVTKRARRPSAVRGPRLLRDLVYDRVKEWIITGEFVPGEFLGEASLARRPRLSRPPALRGRPAKEGASMRHDRHEPAALKVPERLADRGAADAEALAE